MLLIIFVDFRVVARRSRTQAGCPHAISGQPMLIPTCHAMSRCAVALWSRFQNGMVVAWHGRGMACVNQTRPHCVNQMGNTQSKPLAARHGSGTARYLWISLQGIQTSAVYTKIWSTATLWCRSFVQILQESTCHSSSMKSSQFSWYVTYFKIC
jgi:hypothetical protein